MNPGSFTSPRAPAKGYNKLAERMIILKTFPHFIVTCQSQNEKKLTIGWFSGTFRIKRKSGLGFKEGSQMHDVGYLEFF